MGSSDVNDHDTDIDSILADTNEIQGKLPTNKIMGSSDVNDHDTDIDSILVDTNEIQGKLPTNYIMGSSVVTDKDDEIDAIKVVTDSLNDPTAAAIADAVWDEAFADHVSSTGTTKIMELLVGFIKGDYGFNTSTNVFTVYADDGVTPIFSKTISSSGRT